MFRTSPTSISWIFGQPFVKRFTLSYQTIVSPVCPVCDVGVLWPNGWTDQDETWHTGKPRRWPNCVIWKPSPPHKRGGAPQLSAHVYCGQTAGCHLVMEVGLSHRTLCLMRTSFPPQKGGGLPLSIFCPFLLWPNGWMHQDATWYGGRPQLRRLCVTWGHSSPQPKKGTDPQFSAHVYCGEMTTCIRIPDGMEVGLILGDPAPPPLKGHSPQFFANVCCGQMAGWTNMPLGMEIGLRWGDSVFDGDLAHPRKKRHSLPPNF